MTESNRAVAVTIVAGVAGVVLMALLVVGTVLFDRNLPLFQILPNALVGAVAFAFRRAGRMREAFSGALFLAVLLLFFDGGPYWSVKLLFMVATAAGAYLHAAVVIARVDRWPFFRPLVLATLISAGFILVTLLLTAFHGGPAAVLTPIRNGSAGFLIGAGMGAGFEIAERFVIGRSDIPAA